jgi:hypothetical protein
MKRCCHLPMASNDPLFIWTMTRTRSRPRECRAGRPSPRRGSNAGSMPCCRWRRSASSSRTDGSTSSRNRSNRMLLRVPSPCTFQQVRQLRTIAHRGPSRPHAPRGRRRYGVALVAAAAGGHLTVTVHRAMGTHWTLGFRASWHFLRSRCSAISFWRPDVGPSS